MAIPGGLTRGFAKSQKKVAVVQAAITGTGAIASGLVSVDTGGAQVTVQNAETTITSNALAAVTSISAGSVSVVVIALAAAANSVSGSAKNVGLVAIGQ